MKLLNHLRLTSVRTFTLSWPRLSQVSLGCISTQIGGPWSVSKVPLFSSFYKNIENVPFLYISNTLFEISKKYYIRTRGLFFWNGLDALPVKRVKSGEVGRTDQIPSLLDRIIFVNFQCQVFVQVVLIFYCLVKKKRYGTVVGSEFIWYRLSRRSVDKLLPLNLFEFRFFSFFSVIFDCVFCKLFRLIVFWNVISG